MTAALDLLGVAVNDAMALDVDDVEISHARTDLGMTRFANSYFTQAGVVVEPQTRVRVILDGKVGAASTSGTDRESLAAAARLARDIAIHQPRGPITCFARPSSPPPKLRETFDDATARFSPADRADLLARVFARAAQDRLVCAGSFVTGVREYAVATGGGVSVSSRATTVSLSVIALDLAADVSGYAAFNGPSVGRLDAGALADEAVERAARGRDPIELGPGAYDVLLSPHAVSEVLEWMAIGSFSGRAVIDGTSFLAGGPDRSICDERITIVDDASFDHPDAIGLPFDAEGVWSREVRLVERGRTGRPLTDLASAAKLGVESTGHALPSGISFVDGAMPVNLIMLPGDESVDELMGRMERGLAITRFHYVNGLLDTKKATMTGMTRDGLFLVENGKLGRAVRNLRWTENLLEALSRVDGIGRDLRAVAQHWTGGHGACLCPHILLRDFHFTGRSR